MHLGHAWIPGIPISTIITAFATSSENTQHDVLFAAATAAAAAAVALVGTQRPDRGAPAFGIGW